MPGERAPRAGAPRGGSAPGGRGGGGRGGVTTAAEATSAVVQIRMISQGLASVVKRWDEADVEEDVVGKGVDHCSFKAKLRAVTDDAAPGVCVCVCACV